MSETGNQDFKTRLGILLLRSVLALVFTLLGLIYFAVEGFFYKWPVHPQNQPAVIWLVTGGPIFCLILKLLERMQPIDPELAGGAKWLFDFGDRLQALAFARAGFIRLTSIVFILLFTGVWVPENLLQPLWTDHEHLLVMARLWDSGQFPWTAMHTYQFPGEMELAWAFSQMVGWGNPIGFHAMDVLLSALFCSVTLVWSHRQFGHWGYGLATTIALVLLQASLPFTNVAQREAHATLMAMIAFLLPGTLEKRKVADLLSALFFAFGLAIRPHVILFLPMMLAGFWWAESSRTDGRDSCLKRALKRLPFWGLATIGFGLLFMEPVLGPWRTPTFMEALQFPIQQTGSYAKGPFAHWQAAAWDYFIVSRHFWFVAMSLAMTLLSRKAIWRQRGLVMLLVAFTGGFYRMVHPVDHGYLRQPLQYLECMAAAVFMAWVVAHLHYFKSWAWFAMLGLCLHVAEPEWPLYVDVAYAPQAYQALLTGQPPSLSPPGSIDAYTADESLYHYSWTNWNQMICWFRLETNPNTRILNLLSYHPFPSILGTVDRLPIGRLESIVLMNWFMYYDFDSEMVKSLENAPAGSLVAWDGERTNQDNIMRLVKTSATIRTLYQKRIDFGEIEIWEKLPVYP